MLGCVQIHRFFRNDRDYSDKELENASEYKDRVPIESPVPLSVIRILTEMIPRALALTTITLGVMGFLSSSLLAQRQMENLSRGLVAVKQADGVFVSWRLFGTDEDEVAFRLLRRTDQGEPALVSDAPITGATHFLDKKAELGRELEY